MNRNGNSDWRNWGSQRFYSERFYKPIKFEELLEIGDFPRESEWSRYMLACNDCDTLWYEQENLAALLSEANMTVGELEYFIEIYNDMLPAPERTDLEEVFHFSYGLCVGCWELIPRAQKIQQNQIKEGNFDCFGTAIGGCSEYGRCRYYNVCMITPVFLQIWSIRVKRLAGTGRYPHDIRLSRRMAAA